MSTGQVNGPDADVRGVEIALQHVFGNSGFGFQANATLVSTNRKFPTKDVSGAAFAITGLANSANFVGFYDKHGLQARVAVNWRGSYLLRPRTGAGRHLRRRACLRRQAAAGRCIGKLRRHAAVHRVRRGDQHQQFQLQHPWPLHGPAAGHLELWSPLHCRGAVPSCAAPPPPPPPPVFAPPPPPPAPPPATQTCADGTVILATDTCPAPPPPPPPPPPAPERG